MEYLKRIFKNKEIQKKLIISGVCLVACLLVLNFVDDRTIQTGASFFFLLIMFFQLPSVGTIANQIYEELEKEQAAEKKEEHKKHLKKKK